MSQRLRLPGRRDVRATIDRADAPRVVVACPPNPQMGGDRRDARLRAVSDAVADHEIACLRFDYGPWDGGRGARTDGRTALAWARDRFEAVGLFGYSFGGAVALLTAADAVADRGDLLTAISVLSPAAECAGDDVAEAVDALYCPLQVVYGERDDTVDSTPVAERARERGQAVETVSADHFFVGQQDAVAATVASFFGSSL